MAYLSTLLLSTFVTVGLVPILIKIAYHFNAFDFPNERKIHTRPIPRIGGIAMALGVFLPILFFTRFSSFAASLFIGAGIIVLFGFLDDLIGLDYRLKFVGQVTAAAVVVFYGKLSVSCLGNIVPESCALPSWASNLLALIAIVAVTNAINFEDGLDGLAGGIMLIAFICIAYLAYRCANFFVTTLSFAAVGAILGFLRFNTHPAVIFMGDAGSQFIGFLSIVSALAITQSSGALSPFFPLLLFGLPILDTFMVVAERVYEGRSPFKADKCHFHHKLMGIGLFQTEAVFVIYVCQLFFVVSAYFFRFYSEWFLLVYYCAAGALLLAGLHILRQRNFHFQRTGYVDTVIKKVLKIHIKESQLAIKLSQGVLEAGVPMIFLFACLIPATVPPVISLFSLFLLFGLFFLSLLKEKWLGAVLRMVFYLLVPCILFLGGRNPSGWITLSVTNLYNLFFLMLTLALMLVLKYTRRQKGFRATPTDFLVIFIALVVPNLPDENIQSMQLGFLAIQLIFFFFGIEVLIGELRGKLSRLGFSLVPAMGYLAVRGVL